jgi:c-di-AMP phosphodiesterase-like protein
MGKNLANCKPSEFLKQTFRIKKNVEKWLDHTDIMSIRKNMPEMLKIESGMTEDQRQVVFEENKKRLQSQSMKNVMTILDAVMDTHADETLELLALCCFIEPEDVDNYDISFYLNSISELIRNESVIGFFTSLAQLGAKNMPDS